MRKLIYIYGKIVFIFFTFIFLLEDVKMNDTSLFYLHGDSVGLQGFSGFYDLSPAFMILLYVAVLMVIAAGYIFKIPYISFTMGNMILAIPVYLVHCKTLFFHPFYSDGISDDRWVLSYVWFIYLAVFGALLLSVYLLINIESSIRSRKITPSHVQ